MFRKMPIILLAVIVLVAIGDPYFPLPFKSFLYGLSLSLKSLILFVLPFLIFSLLFKTAVNIARSATKFILIVLLAVCCSNFFSTLLSYFVGAAVYGIELPMVMPQDTSSLQPSLVLVLPKWVDNSYAMFSGLLLGILFAKFKPKRAERVSRWLDRVVIEKILKALLYIIPVFIAGFVVKLSHDHVMSYIVRNYSLIFVIVACAVFSYIFLIYLIANRFQWRPFIQSLKNMLPAAIAGFGSMSSAASMPLTIIGTEKNTRNPAIARSIIPATVNVHLIGDCFAIPIFAFAVLSSFGIAEPSFINYLIFACFFVLAKFSVAAVPGGGILVMLPILENYLGFNGEMLSLITALYILFDPVITCANVMGNGGFALSIDRALSAENQ